MVRRVTDCFPPQTHVVSQLNLLLLPYFSIICYAENTPHFLPCQPIFFSAFALHGSVAFFLMTCNHIFYYLCYRFTSALHQI